jgi:hypothetical protein
MDLVWTLYLFLGGLFTLLWLYLSSKDNLTKLLLTPFVFVFWIFIAFYITIGIPLQEVIHEARNR